MDIEYWFEFIIVGLLIIVVVIVSLIWIKTKNKKLARILGKIRDNLNSLLNNV